MSRAKKIARLSAEVLMVLALIVGLAFMRIWGHRVDQAAVIVRTDTPVQSACIEASLHEWLRGGSCPQCQVRISRPGIGVVVFPSGSVLPDSGFTLYPGQELYIDVSAAIPLNHQQRIVFDSTVKRALDHVVSDCASQQEGVRYSCTGQWRSSVCDARDK